MKNVKKANEWFKIGKNEFSFACLGMKDEHDEFYAQIYFMLHQSVEKYLKGYLVAHNVSFKKVHDLGYLCKKCSSLNEEFNSFYNKCKILNQFYIPTRYPVSWPLISKAQIQESFQIAKEIIDFIKKDLDLK